MRIRAKAGSYPAPYRGHNSVASEMKLALPYCAGLAMQIRAESYGFRLSPSNHYESEMPSYTLVVRKNLYTITDEQYLRIDIGQQTILLGTHHNGACLFLAEMAEEGCITGAEKFAHIGMMSRPGDMRFSGTDINFTNRQRLSFHYYQGKNFDGRDICRVIGDANFMSVIRQAYPRMDYVFLYQPTQEMADYEAQMPKFNYTGTIVKLPRDSIAILDMGVFAAASAITAGTQPADGYMSPETEIALMSNILSVIADCKIIMGFMSPLNINHRRAQIMSQATINGLIQMMLRR